MLDLEEIFAKGENDHVEFKRSLAEEKEIIETISAFLNHKGGLIIVGYDEKKRDVVDVNTGAETIQRFVNKVKLVTNPQVLVDIYETEYKRKNLLIISVIDYPIKPVSVYGKFYRRRLNSNHLMTPIEISNLHLISLNSSWDYQIAQDSSLKHIDLDIVDFITAYITKEFIITGKPRREERWQYPLDAIREIVINAVIHRDYQEGTHTQIKIYRDKIKFWNSGKLPPDLSIETIKAGLSKSRPRNRLIAQTFKELGLIEKYGSGVKRVIDDFTDYGLDEPNFNEIAGGFEVTVFDRAPARKIKKESERLGERLGIELGEKLGEGLGETQDKIISLMIENKKVTIPLLSKKTGFSTTTIEKHINRLKKKGIIRRKGTAKGGYWEVSQIKVSYKKSSEGLGEKLGERLGEMQGKIISLMAENNKISIPLLSEKIGISTTAIEKHINRLKREGIINRRGSARGGYWEIKIRR